MSNMGNNMEHNTAKKRRAIELGKDLLILLLCCSALLLAIRGQVFSSAPRLFGGQDSRQTGKEKSLILFFLRKTASPHSFLPPA